MEVCPCSHLGGGDPGPADGGSDGSLHPGQNPRGSNRRQHLWELARRPPGAQPPRGYYTQIARENHPVPATASVSEGPPIAKVLLVATERWKETVTANLPEGCLPGWGSCGTQGQRTREVTTGRFSGAVLARKIFCPCLTPGRSAQLLPPCRGVEPPGTNPSWAQPRAPAGHGVGGLARHPELNLQTFR